tara:strand:+ start:390 stop:1865 length:1476 start_codon:yes stop_codon:yes gene_type:complete
MKTFLSHLNESMLDDMLSMKVRKTIKRAGGKIYQIGGVVRDELLGKISKDLDLLVVGVELDDLEKILKPFGKVNMVGKSFGILKFIPTGSTADEDIDISVPRIDSKSTGDGHKDFEVQLGKGITLQQDQLRRDFWINQIAKDVDTGKILDTDGKGMKDIKNKEIRMISPTSFSDDPLRMLRAVQFAARFEFSIEANTFREMKKNAKTIKSVSPDRFQEEFKKLFSKSDKPSHGVKILFDSGLMNHIFVKSKLKNIDTVTMDKLPKDAFPTFIALLMESYGEASGAISKSVLRMSNVNAKLVQSVVQWIDNSSILEKNDWELVKFTKNFDTTEVDKYLKVIKKPTASSRLKKLKVSSIKDLPINGKDLTQLGLRGKMIGVAINFALEFAVNKNTNNKSRILAAITDKFGDMEEEYKRDYKKERENYLGTPKQMERNAARKRARRRMEKVGKAKPFDGRDIHHKDNNPLNNDENNLSSVTVKYNRTEPRRRQK